MGTAGYKTTVKKGGTSTAFVDEAASLVSGKTYQIDDTTKRIWDPTVAVTVEDNGVAVASGDIDSLDYLFGKVTFDDAYTVTGPVTISGNYIPTAVIAGANSYNLNESSLLLDDTDFEGAQANGGHRTREYGLHDEAITVTRWDDLAKTFKDALENRETVLVEIRPGGTVEDDDYFRGWFVMESANNSGDLAALEQEQISFQLNAQDATDGTRVAFGWGT